MQDFWRVSDNIGRLIILSIKTNSFLYNFVRLCTIVLYDCGGFMETMKGEYLLLQSQQCKY